MARKKVVPKKKVIKSDPVFVPIVYEAYKENKVKLLNAQIKVLECIRTIGRIKELQKQKKALKLEMYRHLSEAMRLYYQLQSDFPSVNNPSFLKRLEKTVEIAVNYKDNNSSFSYSKKVSQPDELDAELREIQDKLNSLNGSRDIE